MITLTYQYKLKLNRRQTQEIEHIFSVCKSVYNYALAERKHRLKSRKSPVNSCRIDGKYIIPVDLMIAFESQESCPDAFVGKLSLGIDAGIESFIATDKGELIKTPKFLSKALSKLKSLQRRLKHKIKGFHKLKLLTSSGSY